MEMMWGMLNKIGYGEGVYLAMPLLAKLCNISVRQIKDEYGAMVG
jgi:hypothetical protein